VYSVNSISFHKGYGTFATCGSDGCFAFWDKNLKSRLTYCQRTVNKNAITASCFNKDGSIFAYAQSCKYRCSFVSVAVHRYVQFTCTRTPILSHEYDTSN
jgi:WD40 repeat protein